MSMKIGSGVMPEAEQNQLDLEQIVGQAKACFEEFLEKLTCEEGALIVIGASTSEICGYKIGSYSSEEVAKAIVEAIYPMITARGYSVAAQCCEHLNRALILEQSVAKERGYDPVNVVPQPKAGGSMATAIYHKMEHPVAVEHVRAEAGIDIGDTLIGMHLREVAVPLRIENRMIGEARVVCARTRYKCVGGSRAAYDADLM